MGLKENVIIGKLIPAGTGMKRYKNIKLDYGVNEEFMKEYAKYNSYSEGDGEIDPEDAGEALFAAEETANADQLQDIAAAETEIQREEPEITEI